MKAGCEECTYRGEKVSKKERAALERMEDSLVRREDGKLQISYPFNSRAWEQRDNRFQARQVQLRVEESVKRKKVEEEYHGEMAKAIEAGSLRKLSSEEMSSWNGPIHYITLFAVLNNDSKSTRVRVVSNSAMKNAHTHLSFNDTTDSVPNALNDLFNVLVQWRGHEQALMWDLSKAYQSVKTGELELHLRRVLYRAPGEDDFVSYGFTCATFGDDPAAAALELAKRKTSRDAMHIDALAARQVVVSTFVDDGGGGALLRRWHGT